MVQFNYIAVGKIKLNFKFCSKDFSLLLIAAARWDDDLIIKWRLGLERYTLS
jgi:hypothetical protein